jgi:hypothetical protein
MEEEKCAATQLQSNLPCKKVSIPSSHVKGSGSLILNAAIPVLVVHGAAK